VDLFHFRFHKRSLYDVMGIFKERPPVNNNGKYIAYEFFRRARSGEDRFVGALPEKRKDPERITNDSIMNWAKIKIPDEFLHSQIYFIRVRL